MPTIERHRQLLDEIALPFEDIRTVIVEADDETGRNADSVPGKLGNFLDQVDAQILSLLGFGETLFVRRLDADEDIVQTGPRTEREHLVVARDIDRELRREADTLFALPLVPGRERLE
jgi:hypothetical protein